MLLKNPLNVNLSNMILFILLELRATWTATSTDIPEETEVPTTQMPSRNIGSLDEFVLVGGSVSKVKWCVCNIRYSS